MKLAFKISAVIIIMLALSAGGAYLWFIRHAEDLVRQFLLKESNGAIDLRSQRVSYRFKTHRLTLTENTFVTRKEQDNTHIITAQKVEFSLGPLMQIIRKRRLIVDSILIEGAHVGIARTSATIRRSGISLPEELGRIYKLLERSLKNLSIQTFQLTNGSFRLDNAYDSIAPVDITGISLRLEGLRIPKGSDKNRFLHSDRLQVETGRQSIQLPDGRHALSYRRFRLDTRDNLIYLDSCRLTDRRDALSTARFDLQIDTLLFRNLDLARLADENMLKADSLACLGPDIRLAFEISSKTETATPAGRRKLQESVEQAVRQMTGHLEIGHIGVRQANVDVTTTRNGRKSQYQTSGSDFTIDELVIPPLGPLKIGRFDFEIRNYVGYSSDSLYAIRFDSVQLRDRTVSLGRFTVRATAKNISSAWKEIRMKAFELQGIYWPALIFDNRIQAQKATLVEPSIKLETSESESSRKKNKGTFYAALNGFRKTLEMDSLLIRKGSVSVRADNDASLDLNGFNSGVDIRAFLSSSNPTDLIGSLNGFSFSDGMLFNGVERITLQEGRYNRTSQQLILKEASYRDLNDPLVITAEGLILNNPERTPDNRFKANTISWAKADIRMDRTRKRPRNGERSRPLLIGWQATQGNNTTLDISSGETNMTTTVDRLETGMVDITAEGRPDIRDISLEGRDLRLELSGSRSRIGRYALEDGHWSTLRDIELYFPLGDRRIQTLVPRLMLKADLGSFLAEKPDVDSLRLEDPVFRFERMAGGRSVTRKRLPDMEIRNLDIVRAMLPREPIRLSDELKISGVIPHWKFRELSVHEGLMSIQMINIGWDSLRAERGTSIIAAVNPGGKTAVLTDLTFKTGSTDTATQWTGLLRRFDATKLSIIDRKIKADGSKSPSLDLENIGIATLQLGSNIPMDAVSIARNQPALSLRAGLLRRYGSSGNLELKGLEWQQATRQLRWSGLSLTPLLDKYAFTKTLRTQQDHISLRTGRGTADQLDLAGFLQDGTLRIRHLSTEDAELSFFRDRTLPPVTDIIKPLPAGLLKRFSTPFVIDSLSILNSVIAYEEINDRTEKTGFVQLKRTKGLIRNLRNTGISMADSLTVSLRTRLMDTASLTIDYRESYPDTLHGFRLSLGIGRFSMPALNPILEPIASARIRRGRLDTVIMQAVGNEYRAYGEMKMYYQDLNVQFLNRNDYERKTILTRLANFAANTILRKANLKRSGFIYAERIREKGFPNYWIRITLNGILTNAGIRGSSRQERRLRRSLKSGQLPSEMLK
ncbi:MAG: hypothetical protein LW694_12250 [Chitinophagaceae bacterium]|nr:hypothetical protein [Chitinophagaceae bacterium]